MRRLNPRPKYRGIAVVVNRPLAHARRVNDRVRAALDLVRADADASGVPGPPYIDGDWELVDLTVASPELIAAVADRVQEDIIEQLQERSATNWPPCPAHPRNHPLRPAVVDGKAVWACTDGTPYATIGSLFSSPHQARRARKSRGA